VKRIKFIKAILCILGLATCVLAQTGKAQRAYTRTHSVKPGENFIWCASYEGTTGPVWWRIGRVLSIPDVAHPTLDVTIGSGSEMLAITGSGPYNREEVGYGWPERTWLVPLNAPKGLYAAEFSAKAGDWTSAAVVYFLIRRSGPPVSTKILLCYPFSTTLAYAGGAAGGHLNLYDSFQPGRARRVSLDRPLDRWPFGWDNISNKLLYTVLAPFLLEQFIKNLPGNPDVDLCTSFDLNNDPNLLNGYNLFLSAGHDEYWSKEMRDHVESFVASGGNAAFFSANTAWWQVRFENGNRVMVCHKSGVEDPLAGVDDARVTGNFASSPTRRDENTLTGVSYRRGSQGWSATPFTVLDKLDPFVFGAPLGLGDTFGSGLFGLETDAADYEPDGAGGYRVTGRDGSPLNFKLLAVADLPNVTQAGRATMGYFKNHGTVFTAATTDWCFPLADLADPAYPAVARITKNVVTILSERLPGPAWSLPSRSYPDASWSFIENVGIATAIGASVHGQVFVSRGFGTFAQKDPENPGSASVGTSIPALGGLTCLGSDLCGTGASVEYSLARAAPEGQGGGKVLFYNSAGTLGIIGRFDPGNGNFQSQWTSPGFVTGWSHIISTHSGKLFFYNQQNGECAWGTVTSAGAFSTEGTASGLLTGWEQIVPAGIGFLLFYKATGQGALAEVRGAFATLHSWAPGGLETDARLGAAANGLILFYHPDSGAAVTVGFNADGLSELHRYENFAFSLGWEHLVTLDPNVLRSVGRLSIAKASPSCFSIRLETDPYATSHLQRAAKPTGPWTTLTTLTAPKSGVVEYQECNPAADQAFYRTITPP
jgi:hypothetical protein